MQTVKLDDHIISHVGGKLHSENGIVPAIAHPNYQEWHDMGLCSRTNGPARMFKVAPDGQKNLCEWWMSGKFITSATITQEAFNIYWYNGEILVHPLYNISSNGAKK